MKTIRMGSVLVVASLTLMACGSGASEEAGGPATVRVNVPGHLSDAPIFIAKERGYFEEVGITLEESRSSAPDSIPLLASGQLDVTGGAVGVGFINSLASDVSVRIVADKGSLRDEFPDYGALVVPDEYRKETLAETLEGIKTQSIGANCLACTMQYNVEGYFAEAGVDSSGIDIVPLDGPGQLAALENGSIAAAHMLEPALSQALKQGIGEVVSSPSEVGQHEAQMAPLMYSEDFSQNTDVANRFMIAYLKGVRDYVDAFFSEGNAELRAELTEILMDNTEISDQALFDVLRYPYMDPDGRVNLESLELQQDYYLDAGLLEDRFDLSKVVDTSFAEAAVDELGAHE